MIEAGGCFEPCIGAVAVSGIVFGDGTAAPDGSDFTGDLEVYQFPGEFSETGIIGWTQVEESALFGLEVAAEGFPTDCGTLFGRHEQNDKGKTIVEFEEALNALPGFGLAQVQEGASRFGGRVLGGNDAGDFIAEQRMDVVPCRAISEEQHHVGVRGSRGISSGD